MRQQLVLTAALVTAIQAALAAPASAGAQGSGAAGATPVCSISRIIAKEGQSIHLNADDCEMDRSIAPLVAPPAQVGVVDRAIAFLFGAPAPVPTPRATVLGPEPIRPALAAVASAPDKLRCAVDVSDRSKNRQVLAIALRSPKAMSVSGEFEVTVKGNGTQRFGRRLDAPLQVSNAREELVVLASTNRRKGEVYSGSVLTDRGERIECEVKN